MKAISKLTAIIILIGVTLSLTTVIALWISGLIWSTVPKECLDIVSAYVVIVVDKFNPWKPPYYRVEIDIVNMGESIARIDDILINSQSYKHYGKYVNITNSLPIELKPGKTARIFLNMSITRFSHGQMINVIIHTAEGGRYPTTITLP